MRSLTVILSEYISLKAFEAHAAAERTKTEQLLRNLYGLLEDFRPGSSRGQLRFAVHHSRPQRELQTKGQLRRELMLKEWWAFDLHEIG